MGGEVFLAPPYHPNPSIDPVLARVKPGNDGFPLEKPAEEITERLAALGAALRGDIGADVGAFLTSGFQGTSFEPAREHVVADGRLRITRSAAASSQAVSVAGFREAWTTFVAPFARLDTTEIEVVGIEAAGADAGRAEIVALFDFVGPGRRAARVQKTGRWTMAWEKDARGVWRIATWSTTQQTRSETAAPVFTEVSSQAFGANRSYAEQLVLDNDYWRTHVDGAFLTDVNGHNGISAGDYDGDGLDDLYVAQPAALPNRLLRNRGDGTFEDTTAAAGVGLLDATSSGLFADIDNDGDQDLVVVTFTQPLLFVNDGRGAFTHKPRAFKFGEAKGYLTSATIADYDRDGFLDLYVCVYSFFLGEGKYNLPTPYHDARNGPPNILFRNDGLGGFVDVTKDSGLDKNNDRFSFAAAWGDFDADGWPDLQVANDFGRKNLYRNNGRGPAGKVTFTDVTTAAGVEDDASAGMSSAWLDYDGDGRLDIYFGNMWSPAGLRVTHAATFLPDAPAKARESFRRHARGNTLYRNLGDGRFADVSTDTGVTKGRWAWSSEALDFDSDGWEDLFVVNGFVTNRDPYPLDSFFWRQTVAESPLDAKPKKAFEDGWKTVNKRLRAGGSLAAPERNVLLRNDGKGGFDHVEGVTGLDLPHDGRAFAALDHDQDGDPDLAIASRSGPRLRLFRNDHSDRGHGITVRLTGTKSNRDAIGARVSVETEGGTRVKVVQAGTGFLSQGSKTLHFGLGRSGGVRAIRVRWPNGDEQSFGPVPIDHHVSIEEGAAAPTRVTPFAKAAAGAAETTAAASPVAPAFEYRGTWLYSPYPAPEFALVDLAGEKQSLARHRPKPVVLLAFQSGVPACADALKDLDAQHAAIEAAGAAVLALAMDGPDGKDKARAFTRGLRVPVAVADEDTILAYSVLHRSLFDRADEIVMPTAFLVDARGDLVKIYRGAGPAAQIAADVARITATAEERLARAVPFPGRFYGTPPGRNHFQLGIELSGQGLDAPALAAFERHATVSPDALTYQNLGTLYLKKGQKVKARTALEKALALQPSHAEASNSLGALLAQSGDVRGAVAHFQAALKAKPEYADAMNNLGYAYLQMERDAEALRLFEQAVKIQPELAEAHNNLGIFHGQQGDLEKAERYFRAAATKKPRYSEARNNLAMVVAALGRGAEAVRILQDSIQEDPAFEMSYVTLSKIYLEAGRPREATQVLERLLQRNPKHPIGLQILQQLKGAPSGGRP